MNSKWRNRWSLLLASSLTVALFGAPANAQDPVVQGEEQPPYEEELPPRPAFLLLGAPAPQLTVHCDRTEYVIDGDGGAQGVTISGQTTLTVPQGTGVVRVRVILFSREWPQYTGQQSEFDDIVTWSVTTPGGTVTSGSRNVNSLHNQFASGTYPGGNWTAYDADYDFSSQTQNGTSSMTLLGTALNISDSALGSGVAFVIEGLGLVKDITILDPATAGWTVGDKIPDQNVMFNDQVVRILVRLNQPIQNIGQFNCPLELRVYDRNEDAENWRTIAVNGDDVLANGTDVRIRVTWNELRAQQLGPSPLEDSENEHCSSDKVNSTTGASNRFDSDAFDTQATSGGRKARGRARGPGDRTVNPPEFAFASKQFLQSAGIRLFRARSGNAVSDFAMLQNQADWLYLSAHGHSSTGVIASDAGPVLNPVTDLANGEWQQDLDLVVIAGCAVLDIGDYNQRYPAPDPNPGLKWIGTGPDVFCGYNWKANLDNAGGDPKWTAGIATRFVKGVNGGTAIPEAWRKANMEVRRLSTSDNQYQRPYNACAIDLRPAGTDNDLYWYFDKNMNPPVWTSKPRSQWPNP